MSSGIAPVVRRETPHLRHAELFVEWLTGSPSSRVTFQTFNDSNKQKSLARILHGTLEEHAVDLQVLNDAGAGIFVAVNETDLKGRRAENVVAVRALFADFDSGPPRSFGLDPSFVVQSARGPHAYWLLLPGAPLPRFRAAQLQLAAYYASDSKVCDLPRVMRLPGFLHRKGNPVLVTFVGGSLKRHDLDRVLASHPPARSNGRELQRTPIAALPLEILEGDGRDNALASLAGTLLRRGMSEAEIVQQIAVPNRTRCQPPLSDEDLARIARSISRYQVSVPPGPLAANGRTGSARLSDLTTAGPPVRRLEFVRLDTVAREKVEWLWTSRLPLRKITDLYGDGDLGKSTLLVDLAARVTRGRELPGDPQTESPSPRNVIVLSAEDGVADTIRARFDEAGGDPEHLFVLISVKLGDGTRDLFSLSEDIQALQSAMIEKKAILVIIDPFSAYLGKANAWKDQEVRRVLALLAAAAETAVCAVVILRHPNKAGSDNPMHAAGGSIGISAACRSGLMVVKDPDDEGRRLLATYKHNLCKESPTLAYRLVPSSTDPEIATIQWDEGADSRSAKQLLASVGESFEDRSARGDARHFLRSFLSAGARPSTEVMDEAKKEGHSIKTLRRALNEIGESKKNAFDDGWVWRLR